MNEQDEDGWERSSKMRMKDKTMLLDHARMNDEPSKDEGWRKWRWRLEQLRIRDGEYNPDVMRNETWSKMMKTGGNEEWNKMRMKDRSRREWKIGPCENEASDQIRWRWRIRSGEDEGLDPHQIWSSEDEEWSKMRMGSNQVRMKG